MNEAIPIYVEAMHTYTQACLEAGFSIKVGRAVYSREGVLSDKCSTAYCYDGRDGEFANVSLNGVSERWRMDDLMIGNSQKEMHGYYNRGWRNPQEIAAAMIEYTTTDDGHGYMYLHDCWDEPAKQETV